MKILITNGNSRMALCVARELLKRGHKVVVSDYIRNSICFFSSKIKEFFIYPSPYSSPHDFIQNIIEKVKELKIDILFPIFEETFLISKYIDVFENIVAVAVPKYDSLLSVHNKDKLYDLLINNSITTPKTKFLHDFNDYNQIRKKFPGKIVLKPKQGEGIGGFFSQISIKIITNKLEIS